MNPVPEGTVLWRPTQAAAEASHLMRYRRWLQGKRGLRFDDYQGLWRWSVDDPDAFWGSVWEFFELQSSTPYTAVLGRREMPGAEWFPGARVNLAREVLGRLPGSGPVIFHCSENRPDGHLTSADLRRAVAGVAAGLRKLGVEPGDRVVGYLPNLPETAVALLGTVAVGAVWSCCSPDFGRRTVVDRFSQLAPKVLIAVDGYRYGGRDLDRTEEIAALADALPSLERVVIVPNLGDVSHRSLPRSLWFDEAFPASDEPLTYVDTAFDDPLWVVFTSGTTGLPKGIVHGHGGIVLELLKGIMLQGNVGPGSTFFFYTTSGWINFNILIGSLLTGTKIVLCDGHPADPAPDRLWRIVEAYGVTGFGASPAYVQLMRKLDIKPNERFDLDTLRTVVLTGSHVAPEHFVWFYECVRRDLAVVSTSGGTEVSTGFFAGAPTEPVRAGEMQVRALGIAVDAFDPAGRSLVDEVGELVVTRPMPSMPLRLWNDPEGRRYRDTYFDLYPGVWRHGDLLKVTQSGGGVIYGRSDSTLNRDGVRIGTGEIYRIVESIDEVRDSLVVNADRPGGVSELLLFVVLAEGITLTTTLERRLAAKLRSEGSPRHVFNRLEVIGAVPYTLTGKKMEVPIKRLLAGVPVERAVSRDAMADPGALDALLPFIEAYRSQTGATA